VDSVEIVKDIAEIREIYGEPMERTIKKQLPRLEKHSRAFIALSPFLVIASTGPSSTPGGPKTVKTSWPTWKTIASNTWPPFPLQTGT